jgi:AraC-like DNA-binding protein
VRLHPRDSSDATYLNDERRDARVPLEPRQNIPIIRQHCRRATCGILGFCCRAHELCFDGPETDARGVPGDDQRPRRPVDSRRARLLLEVVITELARAPQESLRLPEPSDTRLKAVTDLLHADPASPATLAELGHRTGSSERTLSRLFSSELSMSFHQWRTLLRIQRALLELCEGASVTDTAMRLGWANPSSFIEAFTDLLGQTPGRYRATARAAHD